MRVTRFTLLIGCLIVIGCAPAYYLERTVNLGTMPSKEAIEAALREVPEIQPVEDRPKQNEGQQVRLEGTLAKRAGDAADSGAGNGTLAVRLWQSPEYGNEMRLSRRWQYFEPKPIEVEWTRGVMDNVYASLRKHMPELPPASEVHERYGGQPW